ncbi:hypothetical protein SSX86_008793 [Deinandra increscens subsp. villosa]|uniref:Protein TAPETUM DETERMINANT 1-like n=1 Tax=Deinandra increscens subsp. villosa TaxID=3103831 RepID=A0AAP0H4B8_9ASTR
MTLTSVNGFTKKSLALTLPIALALLVVVAFVTGVISSRDLITGTLQFGSISVDPTSSTTITRKLLHNHGTFICVKKYPILILFLLLACCTGFILLSHSLYLYLLCSAPAATEMEQPNRIWGDKCSKSDIVINQGPTDPLPSGIPTYTVEIINVCTTGCDISAIHLTCGWFSSARLINPRIFKRLRYDDCLVNNGNTLVNGHTVSFQYANTFRYPLSVSSVIC